MSDQKSLREIIKSVQSRHDMNTPTIVERSFRDDMDFPLYLQKIYGRTYLKNKDRGLSDGEWLSRLQTFFFIKTLTKCVCEKIPEKADVLQLGVASGSFERDIAAKMHNEGTYLIEDLSPARLRACHRKLSPWLNITVEQKNICDDSASQDKKYDLVICFFIMHELPDGRKKQLIRRAYNSIKTDGQIVFVDYHKPSSFNPLGYFVKRYNRIFEPFAESLFYHDIQDFSPSSTPMIWDKKTFCGGLYQCVTARKKHQA